MKLRAGAIRAEWRVDDVVHHLRRDADDDDLVLEKSAVAVVRVPEFRIENFVKRSWRIGLVGAEADQVGLVIPRHVRAATDLLQAPGGKGIEYFLARMAGGRRAADPSSCKGARGPVDRADPGKN